MQTFTDWEKTFGQPVKPEEQAIQCKCGCKFFEEIRASQFMANHNVILGQPVPPCSETFIFYRCLKCKDLTEPRLLLNRRDTTIKMYEELVASMDEENSDEVQDNEPEPVPAEGDE